MSNTASAVVLPQKATPTLSLIPAFSPSIAEYINAVDAEIANSNTRIDGTRFLKLCLKPRNPAPLKRITFICGRYFFPKLASRK
jgi:hypothetical protein